MSQYGNRDLGEEYQSGIGDMLSAVQEWWLQSGMGLLNPNNPVYESSRKADERVDFLRSQGKDPLEDDMYLGLLMDSVEGPTLDPGGLIGGAAKGVGKALAKKPYKAPKVSKSKAKSASVITGTKYTPPSNTYFNLQNLDQVPNVPQKNLPRREPTKGAKETFEPYITRQSMNRMNEAVDKGIPMGGMEWFNLSPLRTAFINEYGSPVGEQMFTQWVKINAPMSIQSTVPGQIRRGQYFYNRHLNNPATFTNVGNPQLKGTGYGHIGLENMKELARRQLANQHDINKGQKIPSYTQNLLGNYKPVTGDVHNVRLMTNMDHLDSASPEAYKIIEQPQQVEAIRKGLEPAQYQASAWIGGGDITGLKSRPIPFMEIYDNMLRTTAQKLGRQPKDLLKDLLQGKANFLAIPLSAAAVLKGAYEDDPGGLLSTPNN